LAQALFGSARMADDVLIADHQRRRPPAALTRERPESRRIARGNGDVVAARAQIDAKKAHAGVAAGKQAKHAVMLWTPRKAFKQSGSTCGDSDCGSPRRRPNRSSPAPRSNRREASVTGVDLGQENFSE